MEPFTTHRGTVVTLDRANVDTDQIIPKQFLKSIRRTGFGEALFCDWRYLPDGKPNPDFVINKPVFRNATILVARNNFGCGSSREHAVWAIQQYGFKVVIAPWKGDGPSRTPAFADIFRNNSFKNGLLTIELSEAEVEKIFCLVSQAPGLEATINLTCQQIAFEKPESVVFHFEIDSSIKERILNGLDDIGITLHYEDAVRTFEQRHNTQLKR